MITKWIYSIGFILFAALHVSGQSALPVSSSVIQDQYIVQLSDKDMLDYTIGQIQSEISGSVRIKILTKSPFYLLLIETNLGSQSNLSNLLSSIPGVITAIPNRRLQLRGVPNDPLITSQWQYNNTGIGGGIIGADMEMYKAWDVVTGGVNYKGDTIVVCVIDDGVNGFHEDLASNMWVNHGEIPGNGIDDDENGYVDDYLGWNVKLNSDSLYHSGSHGTPVAGIIGAKGNNAIGVSGVNWHVKILPINYGDATEANALASYSYAYVMRKLYNETNGKKGAFIVATNSSWGIDNGFAEEAPLWCSLYDSLGAVGIINVAATANKNTDVDVEGDLPTTCTSPYLISVTNLNNADQKVSGAGYGRKSIDLGAYGQQVYTINRTAYGTFGGTSAATPHVAGMLALLYAIQCPVFDSIVVEDPAGAARIARDMMLYGVVNLAGLNNITTTGGKLNAYRAVTNMQAICTNTTLPAGLSVLSGDNDLILHWLIGSEQFIRVRYRKTEDQIWTVIHNFKNGDTIPNLLFCTDYEVQIGSIAGFLPGDFGYSTFIKTSGCCNKPEIYNIETGFDQIAFSIKSDAIANYLVKYYNQESSDTIYTISESGHFVLEDIPVCHAYNFSVQAQCLNYGNISSFTDGQFITTQCAACTELSYCSEFQNSPNQEWISSFNIENQGHTSGKSQTGYTDFAGVTVFNLKKDTYYSFKVVAGYKASTFAEHFKIFIDFNQDGEWSQDELIYKTTSAFRNELIDNIFIPPYVKSGFTRMRIILSYELFEDSCEKINFEYGEVEDYCVWIESNCNTNPIVNISTTMDSALFNIDFLDENPILSRLYWKKENDPQWNFTSVNDSIVILSDLTKCSKYNYYFENICVNLDTSITALATFKTECTGSTISPLMNFQIYPNPVDDFILISINQNVSDTYVFSLTDILGHKISVKAHEINPKQFQIYTENLNPGIYFLKMELPGVNQFALTKFIKQ